MKLGKCVAENFGSYKYLEWNFQDDGLSLVYGPTGAGKSTFEDLPCWALFGRTAKDGAADDIKSWGAYGPTRVEQNVLLPGGKITVIRTRGNPGENDLYWLENDSADEIRGTDLADTQKKLNERLGINFDLYFTGAYFSEFSDIASFFTARAKDRRALIDKVVSMEFPTRLVTGVAERKKSIKQSLDLAKSTYAREIGQYDSLEKILEDTKVRKNKWSTDNKNNISAIAAKIATFEEDKSATIKLLEAQRDCWDSEHRGAIAYAANEIEILGKTIKPDKFYAETQAKLIKRLASVVADTCDKCGNPVETDKNAALQKLLLESKVAQASNKSKNQERALLRRGLDQLLEAINPAVAKLETLSTSVCDLQSHLRAEQSNKNPFSEQLETIHKELLDAHERVKAAESTINNHTGDLASLDQLHDITMKFRGKRLQCAVIAMQDRTNAYLETYFDAEIRIMLTLEGADNLEVSLLKDGHPCVYKQLSKGQRALLKLCFSVTVMHAVANKVGVHFESIFLDEALDGLDTNLKVKAFRLLQELANQHTSVYVIDHADALQECFSKRYRVEMINGESIVELEE